MEKEVVSLIGDIAKIGFPSVVAIISSAITYKIAVKNANQNKAIAEKNNEHQMKQLELQIAAQVKKQSDEHMRNIGIELSNLVSEYNYLYIEYMRSYITYGKGDSDRTGRLKSIRTEAFLGITKFRNEKSSLIDSKAFLLGDEAIIEFTKKYNSEVFLTLRDATKADGEVVDFDKAIEVHNRLLLELGKVIFSKRT